MILPLTTAREHPHLIPRLANGGSGVVDDGTDPETHHPLPPPQPRRRASFYAERGFNAGL
jgi:hypothetical protein